MLRLTTMATLASILCFASGALAQEALIPMGAYYEEPPPTGVGVTASVGGGGTGFIDDVTRAQTDVGGGWDVRVGLFTRFLLSPELAYSGSAQDVEAFGLDNNAILVSNGGEANLRLNILPGVFQPYIFGGIGWRHYNIMNEDFNTSSVLDSDDIGIVPMGAGFALKLDEFILDARGTVRLAFEDQMFIAATEEANMHTWAADLRAGVEF